MRIKFTHNHSFSAAKAIINFCYLIGTGIMLARKSSKERYIMHGAPKKGMVTTDTMPFNYFLLI